MARTHIKIGLLDHMGGGNLGDDATQDAVMHNIKSRWPHAVMIGFSLNPSDTQQRHGIPAYAIRTKTWDLGANRSDATAPPEATTFKQKVKTVASRHRLLFSLLRALHTVAIRLPKEFLKELFFLFHSFRVIRSLDLLIISGGGQLTEWFGPWQFPYTIFKWVHLAKLASVRCVFLNVGAGPLTHPLSKFFVRRALRFANYASFRDEQSRTLVQSIGFKGSSHVYPDTVYGLDIPPGNPAAIGASGKPIVGLAPMPYCDPRVYPEKDQPVYDRFIHELGSFGSWLIRNNYCLEPFGSDIGVDPMAVDDLLLALGPDADILSTDSFIKKDVKSTEELLAKMALMDYVVTCRFHGVVFAHLLNKPVLAISHHPKVATLMNDIGLAEYCVDIRTFDFASLTERFLSLVRRRDEIKRRMAERLACYQRDLKIQFDDLFPPQEVPA